MLISRHRFEMSLEERNKEIKEPGCLADQRFALDQHAIVATTDLKGNITYANKDSKKFQVMTGGELLGKKSSYSQLRNPPKSPFHRDVPHNRKGQVWHGEFCNKRKDGKAVLGRLTVVPFMGEKPISYIAIRTDITERKEVGDGAYTRQTGCRGRCEAKSEFWPA